MVMVLAHPATMTVSGKFRIVVLCVLDTLDEQAAQLVICLRVWCVVSYKHPVEAWREPIPIFSRRDAQDIGRLSGRGVCVKSSAPYRIQVVRLGASILGISGRPVLIRWLDSLLLGALGTICLGVAVSKRMWAVICC